MSQPDPDQQPDFLSSSASAIGNSQIIKNPSAVLLVVEDNDEDFEALTRMMKKAEVLNPIYRCSDGEEALDYLNQTGEYSEPGTAVRPSLVLLDLNLPGTDGRDVLAHVKQTEHLRTIPVVVLTTSSNPKDVQTCYRYGVNSYLLKPMSLSKFQRVIRSFVEFWFDTVLLPDADQL